MESDMRTPPFRMASGGIGCPKCASPLKRGNAPFYLHGEYVGVFESIICEICNYSALTEKGYEMAMLEAKKLGLIGLVEDTPETTPLELIINQYTSGKNNQKILKDSDETEVSSKWSFTEISDAPYAKINNYFTKKSLIKIN